ncbi:MAG: PD40 domain-containing protein, partial [Thermoplasmata archaeon]|nr:PD40 domain-containing protein [Thermoplasmata archaeon]
SNIQRLTHNSFEDYWPSVSPDGSQIAYGSNEDGDYDIYVMNIDGTNRRKLRQNSFYDADPIWSPDGTQIIFGSLTDTDWELCIINADGTEFGYITDNIHNEGHADWRYFSE